MDAIFLPVHIDPPAGEAHTHGGLDPACSPDLDPDLPYMEQSRPPAGHWEVTADAKVGRGVCGRFGGWGAWQLWEGLGDMVVE